MREGVAIRPFRRKVLALPALLIGLCALFIFVTVPLEPVEQLWLTGGTILVMAVVLRVPGRPATLFLAGLSVAVTARYLFWRVSDTMEFESFWQAFFMVGLLLAELYAGLALLLGYFQTLWPLQRKPVPLPRDPADWPTVDVYIPSYNESLDIVRPTVYAALAMDWPPEKLNVYILDDGRRPDFRAFAQAVGCGYVIRPDNRGAKAGNINHAVALTQGEFIAIFDCDHVPTRAFLQFSLGWLLRDRKLAMVQTPHHFYSPDPFERNLAGGHGVPNEGLMFYGAVQPGNDLWNATFFCGSCAVIRRTALVQAGGVPTETVTEDCHLSLRMQRLGWNTAYLRMPLAAGLATERLILHIGQRMRWARGMLQISRIENPLIVSGLSPAQRICYFSAMFHFAFAVPRLVFLTSPLAFLLLGHSVIAAAPIAILAYAGGHIGHVLFTATRVTGNVRHSLWSEVYEVVLALWLLPVTIATLINPRKGKFNVTDKGGLLSESHYDWKAIWPTVVLAVLLAIGVASGVRGLLSNPPDSLEFQAYLLNGAWALLCLVPVLAGIAVGRERKQIRRQARIDAVLPATLVLANGIRIEGHTQDVSLGGVSFAADSPASAAALTAEEPITCLITACGEEISVPSRFHVTVQGLVRVRFTPRDLVDEAHITQVVMGRADAWVGWDSYRRDRPLNSIRNMLLSMTSVFAGLRLRPRRRASSEAGIAPGRRSEVLAPVKLSAILLAFALLSGPALAQPRAGQQLSLPPMSLPPAPVLDVPLPGAGQAPPAAGAAPALPVATPGPFTGPASLAPAPDPAVQPGAASVRTRQVTLTLRQLGLRGPMQLRSISDLQGVLFGIRANEVVTEATLTLGGAMSPALVPGTSQIVVTLNDQFVGTIQPERERPAFGPLTFPLDPTTFTELNRLNFRFAGRYSAECNDPLSGLLWATVNEQSALQLTIARLPMTPNLARLPEPFFDARALRTQLTLPFVLPENAAPETLRAAAIAASWFAVKADYRGASFPVSAAPPATGHAVVMVAGPDASMGLPLPRLDGPTILLLPNPNDPEGQLLVLAGRTPQEAAQAALGLAAGHVGLSGTSARIESPAPTRRQPYDAPRWLRPDRAVRFGEIVAPEDLQSTGYAPGAVTIPLRTAPDLYYWRSQAPRLDIRYRNPPAPVIDLAVSRLDVSVSDRYVRSLPLRDQDAPWPIDVALRWIGFADSANTASASLPPWLIYGDNEVQLRFDMRPLNRGDCAGIPGDVRTAIDPQSSIDISGAHRFAVLPNLAFFGSSGFPFTRMADLSETAVIMPEQATQAEVSAFLNLVGRLSARVGVSASGLTVLRPGQVAQAREKDIILIGTLGRQPAFAELMGNAPVRLDGNRLTLDLPEGLPANRRLLQPEQRPGARDRAAILLGMAPDRLGFVAGFESPVTPGRSVIAIGGGTPGAVLAMSEALADPDRQDQIQGDLILLHGTQLESFRTGQNYTVGQLPLWLWPQHALEGRWSLLVLIGTVSAFLLGAVLYWSLRRRSARRLRGL
ncbi:UDP-forming cellulose synthase catalytic subunit [Plastoroseomonas arctica]|uniref:Cellulose synthase catalytic subunit [UDP-forming] n=1 Tax=Plastoroseomonas arctica TaxID=1509237 RepID=A0AAF1JXZ7_9PROT|nr:UDP-forming cellulose synthase catalytic subunit [Plastoroseomonas arctica]MBR0654623.1 UDP-forming cellulose synthase catalytic subunit [Plastoroseomonas arctica]